jgi:hypothetical protein
MTTFIQSLISNQAQKVDRIPTSVNPVNPVNPVKPTKPISQDDAKPINPVIPKPKEQYVPNPQTDQSHPETIIEFNIKLPIQNKRIRHKDWNLQKELTLQVPAAIKPPKINYPEGLGKRIRIENVGSIAGNIGMAALKGGAAAAGEAAIFGDVTGVLESGEAILGAVVGSGVASGASTALVHSDVANIAGGIVGGVAGRSVGRVLKNRRIRHQRPIEQNTPVVGAGIN